ncbi:hypothetical protein CW705_07690, partial [Candidatus Bathyarchaeota archaeon]
MVKVFSSKREARIEAAKVPESEPVKIDCNICIQFPRARFIKGSWVSLVVEKPNGKLRRIKGMVLNTPILFLQKANGVVE